MNEEAIKTTSSSASLPPCNTSSPVLPPLDDELISTSIESSQIPMDDPLGLGSQDYIIIVPCSDDEDDFDDNLINVKQDNTMNKELDTKTIESLTSPSKTSPLIHPSLSRSKLFIKLFYQNIPLLVLGNPSRITSYRLSVSSSSSCSSISVIFRTYFFKIFLQIFSIDIYSSHSNSRYTIESN